MHFSGQFFFPGILFHSAKLAIICQTFDIGEEVAFESREVAQERVHLALGRTIASRHTPENFAVSGDFKTVAGTAAALQADSARATEFGVKPKAFRVRRDIEAEMMVDSIGYELCTIPEGGERSIDRGDRKPGVIESLTEFEQTSNARGKRFDGRHASHKVVMGGGALSGEGVGLTLTGGRDLRQEFGLGFHLRGLF